MTPLRLALTGSQMNDVQSPYEQPDQTIAAAFLNGWPRRPQISSIKVLAPADPEDACSSWHGTIGSP